MTISAFDPGDKYPAYESAMAKQPPDVLSEHPTQETRNWHRSDQRIRRHGFKIKARPSIGSNLWERRGKVYTEAEVMDILQSAKVK
jgi:hypothetical protein